MDPNLELIRREAEYLLQILTELDTSTEEGKEIRRDEVLNFIFAVYADSIIDQISRSIRFNATMGNKELSAYPPLVDSIIESIGYYGRLPPQLGTGKWIFFDITGIDVVSAGDSFKIVQKTPDLSILGDAALWKQMQYQGMSDTKKKMQERYGGDSLAARRWKWIYDRWSHGSNSKYEQIMTARLNFARSKKKAPHWYFYSEGISNPNFYPESNPIKIGGMIERAVAEEVGFISRDLVSTQMGNEELFVDLSGFYDYLFPTAVSNILERKIIKTKLDDYVTFKVTDAGGRQGGVAGRYRKRSIDLQEFLALYQSGEIKISGKGKEVEPGVYRYSIHRKKGYFTGLYFYEEAEAK